MGRNVIVPWERGTLCTNSSKKRLTLLHIFTPSAFQIRPRTANSQLPRNVLIYLPSSPHQHHRRQKSADALPPAMYTTTGPPPQAASRPTFPLLRLPLELREHIFGFYFDPSDRLTEEAAFIDHIGAAESGGGKYKFDFRLLRVSKQVYREAKPVWNRVGGTFVVVDTPWPTAGKSRVVDLQEVGF